MPASKAQMDATNRYNSRKYDNLRIVIPKGQKAAVEAAAARRGISINALVNALLMAETGKTEEEWKKPEQ